MEGCKLGEKKTKLFLSDPPLWEKKTNPGQRNKHTGQKLFIFSPLTFTASEFTVGAGDAVCVCVCKVVQNYKLEQTVALGFRESSFQTG